MPIFVPENMLDGAVPVDLIEEINAVFDRLKARQAASLKLGEPPSGFRLSNMIRVHCQTQLRRCIDLAESAELLRGEGRGLAALIVLRTVYETVAAFLHFEKGLKRALQPLETEDDLGRVHDFIRARVFSTRRKNLIKNAKTEGVDVSSTSILTQFDAMRKRHKDIREHYDRLSEFAHPNAQGGYEWFAELDPETDIVEFSSSDPSPDETGKWCMRAVSLMEEFEAAMVRVEEMLPDLSRLGVELQTSRAPDE